MTSRVLSCFVFVLLLLGCSQQKDTVITRNYHNLNSYYNAYFNGKEAYKAGLIKIVQAEPDDYTELLPVFKFGSEASAPSAFPDMERVIEKTTKVIDRHSVEIDGDEKTDWIDNSWQLMGQAQFIKREYADAKKIFTYIPRHYTKMPSRHLANIWLARVYMQDGKFEKADKLLKKTEKEEDFSTEYKDEFFLTLADFYIQQKNNALAVTELKNALQYVEDKQEKVRYQFLLAQLYRSIDERGVATSIFSEIEKNRKAPYEMVFYAKLNQALSFDVNTGNKRAVEQVLRDMLADEKNEEYQDEIYYALAELEWVNNNKSKALNLYKQAASVADPESRVKGLAFKKLAETYFKLKDYPVAQVYYDSTAAFLNKEHPDYEEVTRLSQSLADLVQQITIIEDQDSLQRVGKMDSVELENFIIDQIDLYEANKEQLERQKEIKRQQLAAAGNSTDPFATQSGDWYFYNEQSISYGMSQFRKVWGGRPLEDDWRRSNKQVTGGFGDEENGDLSLLNPEDDPNNPLSREYYLKGIPKTEEDFAKSDSMIQQAYYRLGSIYKDQMLDTDEAQTTWEKEVSLYPKHRLEPDAYYQLYRLCVALEEQSCQEKYKSRILGEYPDSDYAKLILDPDYFNRDSKENIAARALYGQTYAYYEQGFYYPVLENCDKADSLFKENYLLPKFHLLRALATGGEQGKEELMTALQKVVSQHSGDEAGKEAEALLATLGQIKEGSEESPKFQPSYEKDEKSKHIFIVVVPIDDGEAAKVQLANFNRNYYSSSSLKVSAVLLGEEKQMISVKDFPNQMKAMNYLRTYKVTPQPGLNDKDNPAYIISYNNYALFFANEDIIGYDEFFKSNYGK